MSLQNKTLLTVLVIVGVLLTLTGPNGQLPIGLAQTDSPVELPGSLPPDLGRPALAPTGTPAHNAVTLVLAPRPSARLDKLAHQLQDPASPLYRHFLTPDQFRQQIAPDQAALDALKLYFAGQGLSIAYESSDNFNPNAGR